jgi:hypothetical protein
MARGRRCALQHVWHCVSHATSAAAGACAQLPVSRFQRDLTDSTVLRNAGMVRHPLRPSPSWAHSLSGPVPLNAAQTPAPRARCCRNIQRATDGTVPSPLLRASVGMLLRRMLRRATSAFHATSYPALHGVRCEVACGYSEYSNSWLHRRGSRTRCSHTRLRWPAWRRSRSMNKVRSHTPMRAGNASHAPSLAHKRACMHAPDTCTRPRSRTQARSFAHTHPRALGRTIAFSNLLPPTLARLNAPTHAHAHASMTKRPW